MTKLERINAAINHKQVDKIPISFRAATNIYQELVRHFNIDDSSGITSCYGELVEALGADLWASGSKLDNFNIFHASYTGKEPDPPYVKDGTFFYPIGIKTVKQASENRDFTYEMYVEPPLAQVKNIAEMKNHSLMKKLENFDFSRMVKSVDNSVFSKGKSDDQNIIGMGNLSGIFMICCFLRGMEQLLTDMVLDKKLAAYIIGDVCEFCLEYNRRELEAFGMDAMYYGTWDDVAGQDGLMFHPDLFKKFFLPYYKKLINNVKEYELPFGWHCCGSVHQVLPMMIDAGIDVFDVVQTSARDMEIERVHALYGKDICMHGCVDVQELLLSRDQNRIVREIETIFSLWRKEGGIILGPSHKIVAETPLENVLLMYETISSLNSR